MSELRYRLVVTSEAPNPKYAPTNYGHQESKTLETEHLRVTLTEDEFMAVKLALLAEMQPKKDGSRGKAD